MEDNFVLRARKTEPLQNDAQSCTEFSHPENKEVQRRNLVWTHLKLDDLNYIAVSVKENVRYILFKCGSRIEFAQNIFGICLLFFIIFKYSNYLEMLHENDMWFTNIKEVEREISFRTEQGLYYSYYKQLVSAHTLSDGIRSLMYDNSTEYGHVINVLYRFNIFQEIVLATLFKMLSLKAFFEPIFFYIKSVFFLNGLGLGMYFLTSWYMSKSLIAGIITILLYVLNKADSTRVYFTIPLRESFALPFMSAQTLIFIVYLKPCFRFQKVTKLCPALLLITTFFFTLTWQFAQFVLLLQTVALFILTLVRLLPISKVLNIFLIYLTSLLFVAYLQCFQKMLLCSFVLSFIPIAVIIFHSEKSKSHTINQLSLFLVTFQILSALIGSYLLNCAVKFFIDDSADEHIMTYLKAKIFQEDVKDFETKLYLCNPGFNAIDKEIFWRLTKTSLLPLYCYHIIIFFIAIIGYVICTKKDKSDFSNSLINHWLVSRPDVVYVTSFSVFLGLMSLCTLRMKFLWIPYMCLLAPLPLTDVNLLKNSSWFALLKVLLSVTIIILLTILSYCLYVVVKTEEEDLKEFWDPDTVDLMEWIKKSTLPSAVFSGSMQLLAGVKLCTNRSITNHPHFEDKWLRERTKQIYQIYARHSADDVHKILQDIGTTHIILEDSLCLSPSENHCSLPEIINSHNSNFSPDKKRLYSAPLFCNEIRYMNLPYSKYFRLLFYNKTFRVYELLQNNI